MHLQTRILGESGNRNDSLGTSGQLKKLPNPVPMASAPDLLIDYVTSAAISENGLCAIENNSVFENNVFLKIKNHHYRGVEL